MIPGNKNPDPPEILPLNPEEDKNISLTHTTKSGRLASSLQQYIGSYSDKQSLNSHRFVLFLCKDKIFSGLSYIIL